MISLPFDEFGVLLRRDAVACGIDDLVLHRLVRGHHLVRLRHGVYSEAAAWHQAPPAQRHRVLSHGVMRLYPPDVALSHVSAALAWGAPDWGLDLDHVHLTDLDGNGQRRRARVQHHVGTCRVPDLSRCDDHWITSPTRTALDVAGISPRDAAVCVIDDFLHRGLTSRQALSHALALRGDWPQHAQAAVAVGLGRVGAESPGETRLRLVLHDMGIEDVVLQHPVADLDGRVFAYVDAYVPSLGLLLEFDGMVKYHRLRRPGESIEETVIREKRREDDVRERTDLRMMRVIWPDFDRRRALERRILGVRHAA